MTPLETLQERITRYWEHRQSEPLSGGLWLQTVFLLGAADAIAFEHNIKLPYPENYKLKKFICRLVGLTDADYALLADDETIMKEDL